MVRNIATNEIARANHEPAASLCFGERGGVAFIALCPLVLAHSSLRCGSTGFDVPSHSPRDVFEATSGDIERLSYRHIRILVLATVIPARAGGASGRVLAGFVVDNHILAR
jgi:hypothetical protein